MNSSNQISKTESETDSKATLCLLKNKEISENISYFTEKPIPSELEKNHENLKFISSVNNEHGSKEFYY